MVIENLALVSIQSFHQNAAFAASGLITELVMEAMDRLYQLYTRYIDDLRKSAEHLNSLYPEPSRIPIRLMPRIEFDQYLSGGAESESKRLFVIRILNGDEELLARLPEFLQRLTARRAA